VEVQALLRTTVSRFTNISARFGSLYLLPLSRWVIEYLYTKLALANYRAGMFNAINGLGGGGQDFDNSKASSDANSALYATFAVVGFFSGTITNTLGVKFALSFGGIGYSVYVGAYLCFNHTANYGYMVFAGFLLGCCAGVLWSAQGNTTP
jgi:hypothetical protein